LGSHKGNSNPSYDGHLPQQFTVTQEAGVSYEIYSRDSYLSSSTDEDAGSAFQPHTTKHRELITPKPWLDHASAKATVHDEISEDEITQSSEVQVGGSRAGENSASPAHYAEQADPCPDFDEWMSLVTTVTPKARPEDTPRNRKRGRRTIVAQKHLMQAAIICLKYVHILPSPFPALASFFPPFLGVNYPGLQC
jgi:hypothetical protein